jgi:exodeoxyribonuclease V alpha subunit
MNHDLSENFLDKKDDYNFIRVDKQMIKSTVKKICLMSKEKGLNENDIQVLAPMYKGESGIDSLNLILQEIFNPKSSKKKEIKIGDITYREHDKVLQLVNDPDNNVFNGDIGYIEEIEKKNNKDILSIMFDSGTVLYTRESLLNIRHAYAISIHKSQGSEFNHVIIPVTRDYFRMLYNKLIYTGVSRAKKSLVIIGEPESFVMAVNNNYSQNRKTDLLNKLQSLIKDN